MVIFIVKSFKIIFRTLSKFSVERFLPDFTYSKFPPKDYPNKMGLFLLFIHPGYGISCQKAC